MVKKEVKKLELGAGDLRNLEPGWTYHDIQELEGIDIVCDLLDIREHVKEGKVRQLRACHVLEHIPTPKQEDVFAILYDLLAKNGRLYIEVPNFSWHAQLVMQGRDEEAVVYAFGGHLDEYDAHMTGFTPKILERRLKNAGFGGISIEPGSSIKATAYKLIEEE